MAYNSVSSAKTCKSVLVLYIILQEYRLYLVESDNTVSIPCLQPDPAAKPNMNPIQSAPPTFVKSVKNGKLYTVGNGEDMINLVHVWGKQHT